MKSKEYSNKPELFHLIRLTLTRSIALFIPFLLFLIFVMPVLNIFSGMYSKELLEGYVEWRIYNNGLSGYINFGIITASVISAYLMFGFLLSKKKQTPYLLLGVSRSQLFAVRYTAGLAATVLPILITVPICIVASLLKYGNEDFLISSGFYLYFDKVLVKRYSHSLFKQSVDMHL